MAFNLHIPSLDVTLLVPIVFTTPFSLAFIGELLQTCEYQQRCIDQAPACSDGGSAPN